MSGQIIELPSRGVSLYAKVVGNGHPLLLMHGGLGVDHSTLLPMVNCSNTFKLIFYDHRCNGRSIGADLATLTWDNLIEDAEGLRHILGISKWAVLGHSFGGMIAQEYALRYPARITRLILMDTGADAAQVQHNAPRVLAGRGHSASKVEDARRLFNGEIKPRELRRIMLSLGKAYYSNPGIIMQVRAVVNALRIRSRPDTCIYGFKYLLKGWCTLKRLKELPMPVFLIAGRDDFQFPPEHQREMVAALRNARLSIVEKAGHNPLIERPTETIALIREFLCSGESGAISREL